MWKWLDVFPAISFFFFEDAAFMINVFKEISFLSNAVHARNLNLPRTEKEIRRSMKPFEMTYKKKPTKIIFRKHLNILSF